MKILDLLIALHFVCLDHDCFYLRLRNLVKGKVKSLLELLMFSIFSLEEEELIKEMTLTTAT